MLPNSPYAPKSPQRRKTPISNPLWTQPSSFYVTESKSQFTNKSFDSPDKSVRRKARATSLNATVRTPPRFELTLEGIIRSPNSIKRQGKHIVYRGSPLLVTQNCFNKRRDDFTKWGELLLNRGVQVKSHYL